MNGCELVCTDKDRESWLKARKQGLGGSEAAAALGMNPWKSPFQLYVEKVTDAIDENESEAATWGHILEPVILARFGEVTKRTVVRSGNLLRSVAHPWQLATLDGTQRHPELGEGVVEIKASSLESKWEEGPPDYVYCQVQHQLSVTGLPIASVAVLLSGRQFSWYDVERNDSFISELVEREEEFWFRVETKNPPETGPLDKAAISRLFPNAVLAEAVMLDGDFCVLDEKLVALKTDEKRVRAEIDAIENQFRLAIGEHQGARLSNGILYTNKLVSRKEHVVAASSYRQLRRAK